MNAQASATLVYRRAVYPVAPGLTLEDAIRACGLDPALLLAVRDGQVVPLDVVVRPGDQIRLVAVVSGG